MLERRGLAGEIAGTGEEHGERKGPGRGEAHRWEWRPGEYRNESQPCVEGELLSRDLDTRKLWLLSL